ncbi:MAG: protein sphX, partial [Leptolyngbyaceae cyanobacterium CAN_BIN12]|nr:protein sphX [Leptolyngbyaceae cyanobacterium CAN_BIN12]
MVFDKVKLVPNRFTAIMSAAAVTAAVVGLSVNAVNSQGSVINVDGSSKVFPITEKVAEASKKAV